MRAQISLEFLFMIGAATAIVVASMLVFSHLYKDNLADRKKLLVDDFSYGLRQEFIMAGQASDGYSRIFELPQTIDGFIYDVYNTENLVVVNISGAYMAHSIPLTDGSVIKGTNRIKVTNGIICLNC